MVVIVELVSAYVKFEKVGLAMVLSTLAVNEVVFEPIEVEPLNVSQMTETVAEDAFGIVAKIAFEILA